MKIQLLFGWAVGVLLSALILVRIPIAESTLTLDSLKRAYPSEKESIQQALLKCKEIFSDNQNAIEKDFLTSFAIKPENAAENCHLKIAESKHESYFLAVSKALQVVISAAANKAPLFEKTYTIHYALPLSLLPFAAFFLALLFEIHFIVPVILFFSLLFFYSGLNPLELLQSTLLNLKEIISTDKNLVGLCLLFIWTRIVRPRKTTKQLSKTLIYIFGSWNPAFFVIARRAFIRIRKNPTALSFLLSLHAVFLIFSFTIMLSNSWEDIFLPRYFSICFLLLFAVKAFEIRNTSLRNWKLPFHSFQLATILLGETLFHFFSPATPFLTRLSLELICAELPVLRERKYSQVELKFLFSRTSLILSSSIVAYLARQAGLLDLLYRTMQIEVLDMGLPFALFSFGVISGIIFGGITLPFYFILSLHSSLALSSVAKAGLVDGLILGVLLSPFSVFNWFGAKDLHLKSHQLFSLRWANLKWPFITSGIVYFVSGMNTVRILQPVTFLFLLLVLFVNRMRLRRWKWV